MTMDRLNVFTRWFALAVALSLDLTGCGRTSMQAECEADEDCDLGFECVNGFCDVEDEGDADLGCVSDLDCGEGICLDRDGACVGDICNLETGECEVGECLPDCGPDEEEIDCRCIPNQCSSNDECHGRICDSGVCRPCASDAECSGTDLCIGGFCGAGPDCLDDDDCPPHQECSSEQTCVERPECTLNSDCPAEDEQCIAGTCTYTPECEDDEDCNQHSECVGGQCHLKMCRGPEDCEEGEICDAGECVPPPVALYCEVVTSSQTIVPNQQISLNAFAYDEFGNSVAGQFSWNSSDEQVGSIDGNSIVGGSTPGQTTVTAVLQGGDPVACNGEAVFDNLGLSTPDDLRVRVEDMETGQAVGGAEVVVGSNSETTDANGVAYLPDPGGVYEVSVFHDDYNFLTVQGLEAGDIRLPISVKSGTGPVAGFTGEFNTSAISTSGDIQLGLAGASLAGDLLDVNLERLLGDVFYTEFDLGPFDPGGGEDFLVPLPGGVTAGGGFMGLQVEGKQTYYAQAADGPRLAWGMAGEIPIMDMLDVFMDPPTDVGSAIGEFLPLFSRFDHGQYSAVLQARPRVQDTQDINNSGDTTEMLPDYDNFPAIDLMPSVRQQLSSSINISALPVLGGSQAEVAVLLGGTHLDDLGLVPLGISATSDDDGDGQPESRTIYMAPPYGSATGGRYVVMAIAFATIDEGEGLTSDFSVALWNGQTFHTTTSLGTFPDSSSGSIDDDTRRVIIDEATAGPIFRVRHVGVERSWDVWSQGPAGQAGLFSHEITIPAAPQGWSDLFADAQNIFVDSIRITDPSMDDLVRSSGIGLDRAGIVTTSFNRTTYR